MGAENCHRTRGHFIKRFYEECPLVFQIFDDMMIVDDFVQDVDGCTVNLQGTLNNLDCSNHACTKSARLRQYHLHSFVFDLDR